MDDPENLYRFIFQRASFLQLFLLGAFDFSDNNNAVCMVHEIKVEKLASVMLMC